MTGSGPDRPPPAHVPVSAGRGERRRRPTARVLTVLAVGVVAAVVLAVALLAGRGHPVAPKAQPTTSTGRIGQVAGAATATARPSYLASLEQGSTLVARTRGTIPKFARPGGAQVGWVPGSWFRAPSVLPVIDAAPGWFEVRLAQRPNESTAWVLARDVRLNRTPYRIVVDLRTTRLTLYRSGRRVFSAPAGVGTAQYPTPTGSFFVAFFARPPNPGYGAFVIATSAHSTRITDWDFSGDAVVAIHGPLGGDALIGPTGARISHGCVRLHEAALLRLRVVPAGSPVDIVAG